MTGSGLLVLDKPAGLTSHDVVARVRRLAGTRKVGHAGTLDPMATGVLVLGVNRATRLLGHLVLTEKAYQVTIRLGAATTTDDAEGEVTATASTEGLEPHAVRAALAGFAGEIDQVPSSVSAVKVGGQRAYRRVRAGEDVDLPARRVTLHEVRVGAVRSLAPAQDVVDVEVFLRCSSGTYVRALARDLGAALGTGGHLTALRRTAVGPFTLTGATTLADLEGAGGVRLLSMAETARRVFPTRDVDPATARAVSHGQRLPVDLGLPGPVALLGPAGELLALYAQDGEVARPVAVLG